MLAPAACTQGARIRRAEPFVREAVTPGTNLECPITIVPKEIADALVRRTVTVLVLHLIHPLLRDTRNPGVQVSEDATASASRLLFQNQFLGLAFVACADVRDVWGPRLASCYRKSWDADAERVLCEVHAAVI